MSLQITQEMRDANTRAHLQAIADAQKVKRDALHQARLERYPWIVQAREIQKKLNEKESK